MGEFMTTTQVAKLLGLQSQTVRRWRCTGSGPRYVRLGGPRGRVVYAEADVKRWVEEQTRRSTSEETASPNR